MNPNRSHNIVCASCGKVAEALGLSTKYCPECAKIVDREKHKVHERERRARAKASQFGQKKTQKTIAQVVREARIQGLSYGQYVAKIGGA